jgi:hypothetical protein
MLGCGAQQGARQAGRDDEFLRQHRHDRQHVDDRQRHHRHKLDLAGRGIERKRNDGNRSTAGNAELLIVARSEAPPGSPGGVHRDKSSLRNSLFTTLPQSFDDTSHPAPYRVVQRVIPAHL